MPTPKWRLVVDVGVPPLADTGSCVVHANFTGQAGNCSEELLLLIRTYMPADKNAPSAQFLPGFTSLRLLLEMPERTPREEELTHTLTESFASYCRSGRAPSDVACMVARDYMVLTQYHNQNLSPHRCSSQQNASAAPNSSLKCSFQGLSQVFSSSPQHIILQRQSRSFDNNQQLPGQPSA